MDMFTSYGHIIKLKLNHRFSDDFRPGHVPLIAYISTGRLSQMSLEIANALNSFYANAPSMLNIQLYGLPIYMMT